MVSRYPKCFIVGADNVGSKQMQEIRIALRGQAIVLMGKNTMMRKAIRGHLESNPDLERLLPHIKQVLSCTINITLAIATIYIDLNISLIL